MSVGQPHPRPSTSTAMLAYPRPYPLEHAETRVQPRDREVAREAVLATTTLLFVVLAAVTSIAISGWLGG